MGVMDPNRIEIFVPDETPATEALARTTHLGIGAHQDDLEMIAIDGILQAYQNPSAWFTGMVVTDGRSAPRTEEYAQLSDEALKVLRDEEQRRAATIGEYAAVVLLNHPSAAVKNPDHPGIVEEIAALVEKTQPKVVYTHNLADKHPTHVAVALRVVAALRTLPPTSKPEKVYGCEVWRGLDWLPDEDKIRFDTSQGSALQSALLEVFQSQIGGGKRYDLASMGRRRANATFDQSHAVDQADKVVLAMDLSPLVKDPDLDITAYIKNFVTRLSQEIDRMLDRLM